MTTFLYTQQTKQTFFQKKEKKENTHYYIIYKERFYLNNLELGVRGMKLNYANIKKIEKRKTDTNKKR